MERRYNVLLEMCIQTEVVSLVHNQLPDNSLCTVGTFEFILELIFETTFEVIFELIFEIIFVIIFELIRE